MLTTFLSDSGFEVATIKGMNIRENKMVSRQPDYEAYRLAKAVHRECPDADGIYIQCPRLPIVYQIERIERETGLPVVTSTPAYIWTALKRLGIKEHISGFGRLLATVGQ
jgi:maleate isomerase